MNKNKPEIFRPVQPSMKRRARFHDYSGQGAYMLTPVVEGRRPLLGQLILGDGAAGHGQRLPVLCGSVAQESPRLRLPHVELSALGERIVREEIGKISRFYPQVEVWRVCVMPDHIHMIVRVREDLPQGKTLGHVITGFKTGCNRAYYSGDGAAKHVKLPPVLCGFVAQEPSLPKPSRPGLFEPGYNDRLLFDGEQLEHWKHYLDDNPRRLAIKRQHPDLFIVKRGMRIAGHNCQTVGNQFLLDVPDKVAVIVHRRYTEQEYQWLTEQWLACGERGGVLVSAAISPKERVVLKEARERGYNIIWLNENGFPEFYKPIGKAFDACSAGRLLQVSPWEYHTEERKISREQCLELNAMATEIAGGELKTPPPSVKPTSSSIASTA